MTTNKKSTATAPTYTTTSIIAKNSAPSKTKRPAEFTKVKIKNKTECTGFLELTTINDESTMTNEKR